MISSESSNRNRLFAHNRYDSLTDAECPGDWLEFQFKKLKAKRDNNPEILRRKRQEKLLLEVCNYCGYCGISPYSNLNKLA